MKEGSRGEAGNRGLGEKEIKTIGDEL